MNTDKIAELEKSLPSLADKPELKVAIAEDAKLRKTLLMIANSLWVVATLKDTGVAFRLLAILNHVSRDSVRLQFGEQYEQAGKRHAFNQAISFIKNETYRASLKLQAEAMNQQIMAKVGYNHATENHPNYRSQRTLRHTNKEAR